jgi:thioredoxin reductase
MLEITIVGAGPYGLSLAAHFRNRGIKFRIFGRPMDSWLRHMPNGMYLKSDGFASNISDPAGEFTLEHFCEGKEIEYDHLGIPVALDTFRSYGLAFAEKMVPELEDKLVVGVDQDTEGYVLRLDDGEKVQTRRLILAVGITNFAYVPESLSHLPAEYLSHSFRHCDLAAFHNRSVAVIGGGASASDFAALLHEGGVQVQLISRRSSLRFHDKPMVGRPRPMWNRIRHPKSGLGPSLRSRLYCDFPVLFRYLPEKIRLSIVRRHLGPSGGWYAKDKVIGKIPLLLGYTLDHAEIQNGRVNLHIRSEDGSTREVVVDHVIAATGYKVDIDRLEFLSSELRSRVKTVENTPVLSSTFESSVPGLYFVGLAAANSFGPLLRFAFGADFCARRMARAMEKSLAESRSRVTVPSKVATKG